MACSGTDLPVFFLLGLTFVLSSSFVVCVCAGVGLYEWMKIKYIAVPFLGVMTELANMTDNTFSA
jgi:hypothetical protein